MPTPMAWRRKLSPRSPTTRARRSWRRPVGSHRLFPKNQSALPRHHHRRLNSAPLRTDRCARRSLSPCSAWSVWRHQIYPAIGEKHRPVLHKTHSPKRHNRGKTKLDAGGALPPSSPTSNAVRENCDAEGKAERGASPWMLLCRGISSAKSPGESCVRPAGTRGSTV